MLQAKAKAVLFIYSLSLFCFPLFPQKADAEPEPSISELFDQCVDSVVLIGAVHKNKRKNKTGSGFIVSTDGLILTNYHILKKAKKIFVKLSNNEVYGKVKIIASDETKDIALLKINAAGLKPVKMGNSNNVSIGQRVFTIGNPLGLESTISDGLISSIRTEEGKQLLQISVPLSSGSSGGPLFNLKGEVVGMTASTLLSGQNLNFAIPINLSYPLLKNSDYAKSARIANNQPVTRSKQNRKRDAIPLALTREYQSREYTVQPKDTLYSLSRRFNVSVDELIQANRLPGTDLLIGQKLKIPR